MLKMSNEKDLSIDFGGLPIEKDGILVYVCICLML